MVQFRNLFLLLFASLAFACSGGDAEESGAEEGGEGGESASLSAEADSYGAALTVSEITPLADILADPEAYVGQQLHVRGTVVGVCPTRGCWIDIGAGEGEKLRFKVEDGEMVFPMSAKGSEVDAEGVWTKIVVPVEELREIRRAQAEEKGEEFDPESVTEAYVAWQLKGLGARVGA